MREASDSESQQWRAERVKRVEALTMGSRGSQADLLGGQCILDFIMLEETDSEGIRRGVNCQ
jgi:hypothetical protein